MKHLVLTMFLLTGGLLPGPGLAQGADSVEKAYALIEAGDLSAAEKELAAQLAVHPKDPARLAAFAYVSAELKRPQLAIEYARRALKMAPTNTFAKSVLALNLIATGNRKEGIQQLESLLTLEPRNAVAQRNLGLAYFQEGLVEKAIPLFIKWLSASPDDDAVRVDLMAAYFQIGESSSALKLLQDIPQEPEPLALACLLLNRQEHYDQTIARLESYAAAQPLTPRLKLLLAEAWAGQGSVDKSMAVLQSIPASERDSEYAVKLAWAHTMKEELPQAVTVLQQAIRQNPGQEKPFDALANVFLRGGAAEDAIDAAEQGLARHPQSAALLLTLGIAEEYLGRHDRGQKALLRSLEQDPSNGYAYYVLALSFRISGKAWEQTRGLFEQALQRRPKDGLIRINYAQELLRNGEEEYAAKLAKASLSSPEFVGPAQALLGQVYMKQGRWNEAIAALEEAVRLDPANERAVYRLATSYARAGQHERAKESFEKHKTLKAAASESEEHRAILRRLSRF
ncbi:MAG: tetratricopeptide repeat protein [Acidobacteriota bacterium]